MEKILLHELLAAVGGKLLTEGKNQSSGNSSGSLAADNRAGTADSGVPAVTPDANNRAGTADRSDSAMTPDADPGVPAVTGDTEILSVVTDSRKITPGCVFFALCGERFDGHAFTDGALEKGAAGCVISREPDKLIPGKFYVLVEDTLRALGQLAHFYRMKYDVKVIGITGSVGKTTCREMVSAVLSGRFRVHSTRGNFNNEIGLPMTIFDLSPEDEVMVLEMGMNHFGEIARLTRIAAPDIAVITNIGTAHIGILGSRENIFLAKKEIFEGMKEGSAAVLCGDDDFLPQIARDPALAGKFRIFYAGMSELCSYRGSDVRIDVSGIGEDSRHASIVTECRITMPEIRPELKGQAAETADRGHRSLDFRIGAAGLHLVWPATIAAAVADLLGMTGEEILRGLESFSGQRMRCEKYGDILLFDDTYNASPDSMKSSLQLIACLPTGRKAAVLGDMLEQGSFAEALHREVGAAAAQAGIDTLITIGELSADMADEAIKRGLRDVRAFKDRESAAEAVKEITEPGTAILFKASHGMALDRLAKLSREKAEQLAGK